MSKRIPLNYRVFCSRLQRSWFVIFSFICDSFDFFCFQFVIVSCDFVCVVVVVAHAEHIHQSVMLWKYNNIKCRTVWHPLHVTRPNCRRRNGQFQRLAPGIKPLINSDKSRESWTQMYHCGNKIIIIIIGAEEWNCSPAACNHRRPERTQKTVHRTEGQRHNKYLNRD